MATEPETTRRPADQSPSYLPYLTWTLLGLLCLWGVLWFLFYRPSREERLRIEAIQSALTYIPESYIKKVDETELYRAAIKGMIQSLGDKYSAYLTPQEEQRVLEQTRGEFVGIGVTITRSDSLPLIVDVQQDGPAGRAGVERGDVIVQVDGKEVKDLPLDQVAAMIRGDAGTRVTLALRRASQPALLTMELTRKKISLPNVKWEMREEGIALLGLASFDGKAAREVKEALEAINQKSPKGLILDLRNNGGGLVDQAVAICDMLLERGLILTMKGEHVVPGKSIEASGKPILGSSVPMVVLVDEGTASAAEITSGALQANRRATVIGANTVGKGSVTDVMSLPDGSGLILTVAHYELAGGKAVEGEGIIPDQVVGRMPSYPAEAKSEEVKAWLESYQQAKAEQLQAAVEFLKKRIADQ
jgi:carboxyl-terminal processing protease